MAAPTLPSERDRFDVPAEVAYFNTATMSPMLHSVRAAGERGLAARSRPWAITVDDWFRDVERLRGLFAGIIGADPAGVAIVPATSYGFAVAATNLPLGAGRRIVVLDQDYPSGVYTWRRAAGRTGAEIVTVTRAPGQTWTDAVFDRLDERVDVVSVAQVHWTDGSVLDLEAVADRTHELGAALVIDASQSAGAMPIDVERLRPDFLVTVGYKWLLGPMGLGYLYAAEHRRDGIPLEENWINREGSDDFARLVDYRNGYAPGAGRFDVGQRSRLEVTPMAIAALEAIIEWTVPAIASTLADRTAGIGARVAGLGLDVPPADRRGPHLLGLPLPAEVAPAVLAALADANCFAAARGTTLRLAPHLHNTDADVDVLVTALATALDRPPG